MAKQTKRAIAMKKIEALASQGNNIKKIKNGLEAEFPARSIHDFSMESYRFIWNPKKSQVESWVGNSLRNEWKI